MGEQELTPDEVGNVSVTVAVTISAGEWYRLYGGAVITDKQVAEAMSVALGSWLAGSAELPQDQLA